MLDAQEVARRATVPLLDLRTLVKAVVEALHADLGLSESRELPGSATKQVKNGRTAGRCRRTGQQVVEDWSVISTLEPALDTALAGGIPTGYITEITGERYVILLLYSDSN
jgi:DNA repair protein RAD57